VQPRRTRSSARPMPLGTPDDRDRGSVTDKWAKMINACAPMRSARVIRGFWCVTSIRLDSEGMV
jgi:hypothetical protein